MKIETGDCIAVRTAHGILGRLTQIVTASPYTHTGIAKWIDGDLFMSELNGGRNHLIPVSQLTDYDVYAHPDDLVGLEGAINAWLQHPVDYGYLAFAAIGLLNWFKIKAFVHWRKVMVCSGYCVAIYETAGWPERSRVISPRELTAQLTFKLAVRKQ